MAHAAAGATIAHRRSPGTALLTVCGVAVGAPALGVLARTEDWFVWVPVSIGAIAAAVWSLAFGLLVVEWRVVALFLAVSCCAVGYTGSEAWVHRTMHDRGNRVEAIVTSVRDANSQRHPWRYTLRRADGSGPVKGGQLERGVFRTGEHTMVLEDPQGAYGPMLPRDVHPNQWGAVWAVTALAMWPFVPKRVWTSREERRKSGRSPASRPTRRAA